MRSKNRKTPWINGQKRVDLNCEYCGKPFWLYFSRIARKYCSMKCSGLAHSNQEKRECKNCGNEFLFKPSQSHFYRGAGKYCSQKCSYEGMVEENRHKPIKDKYQRSKRKDDKMWQKAVKEAGKNICRKCGGFFPIIHSHHIKPRSRFPELKHDVSNGICLCNSCHSWVHHHPKEATLAGLFYVGKYAI